MSSSLTNIIRKPAHAITILALLQVLSSTYLLRISEFQAINSVLFLVCGMGISYFILKAPKPVFESKSLLTKQFRLRLLLIILLLPASYYLASHIMDKTPLEKEYADMLPVIKTMGTRFMQGHWNQVYDPIPEIWGGIQPIYLPAMWLPFNFSLIFDFDPRWITVCGIWLTIFLCIWPGIWRKNIAYLQFGLAILTILVWLHFDEINNVIRLTEEGVVFFYYALLVVAIISGNPWLVGIAAALCFLSRYALIGWIPFAALYLLLAGRGRYLVKAMAAGVAMVLIILIIPFGWQPLLIHLRLPSDYVDHAARVWHENPEFFYKSPGMAKFFGPNNLDLLHSFLQWGTFIIPLIFLFLLKKKAMSHLNVLLGALQCSITFFYCFIDVSYLYLFYTPVFTSLIIAGWLLAQHMQEVKS